MGTILALGLASDIRSAVTPRVLSAGASLLMAVATYMSLSRGSDLALLLGFVLLTALAVRPGTLLLTAGAVGTGLGVAILRLQNHRVLLDQPGSRAAQEHAGHAFAQQLVLIALAVMALTALIALGRKAPPLQRLGSALAPSARPAAITLAVGVAVVVLLQAGAIGSFISRQANDFWHPTSGEIPTGQARLTTTRTSRSDLYKIVIDGFTADPLRGDGAGGSRVRYIRMRKSSEYVRNAHSLEIETLSELGLVGLALMLAFFVSLIVGAIRARVRPTGGLGRSQGAAVSAASAVWLIHSAFDWDWQLTAVTGLALVLASTLYPAGSRRERRSRRRAREAEAVAATTEPR
jgi:O-antigen ligase